MAMQKQIILSHQNALNYSREFIELKTPQELNSVFWVTVALCVSIFVFLFFGKIDETVRVSGIVRTKQNVSAVNNVIEGKITEIFYKPEQKVECGDVLYRIDSSIYDAQRENLLYSILDEEKRLVDLEQLILSYENEKNLVNSETNPLGYAQFESYLSQLKVMELQEKKTFLVYDEERTNPIAMRVQKNIDASKVDYDLCKAQLANFKSSFIENLIREKKEVQLQLDKNNQELIKMDEQYKFISVTAPVTGFVQEVSSLNVGDYLSSGKTVLNIIPNDEKNFRVEMHIPQKDIGEIKEGLLVKYRFSAFPFFEYKGADGSIQTMDSDIRVSENGGAYYNVYGDIEKLIFTNRKGKSYPIRAGLDVEARVVLETETLIHFLLKKLDLKY